MPVKQRRTIADRLQHLQPCSEASAWCTLYDSPLKAWAECKRGDWMLWLLGRCKVKLHDAAYAAAYAADDAADADADARAKTLAKCADIVRKHFPKPPKVKKAK